MLKVNRLSLSLLFGGVCFDFRTCVSQDDTITAVLMFGCGEPALPLQLGRQREAHIDTAQPNCAQVMHVCLTCVVSYTQVTWETKMNTRKLMKDNKYIHNMEKRIHYPRHNQIKRGWLVILARAVQSTPSQGWVRGRGRGRG